MNILKKTGIKIILKMAAKSLNGKRASLQKLVALLKKSPKLGDGPKNFFNSLEQSLENNTPWADILLRIGKELNPVYKNKILNNLIVNQYITGFTKRESLRVNGNYVPNLMTISPTMRCNLNCTGCYSGLYTKNGELSEKEMENILDQARKMGIYFIVISGGEPFILKDMLLRLFKKYNDMFFLTFTNGTFLDKETCNKLAKLGNVAPGISVEGWKEGTDERRGAGIWEKVHTAMKNLREAGVLFGISLTATRHNTDIITDDRLIEHFIDQGILFGWYFQFMPVGKDPILDLVPTPEQRVFCGKRVKELRDKYPVFLADFWNDGEAVGGCMAGGRQYLHILNSGNVEVCVFAHFGTENIREKPLFDIVNGPLFKEIRKAFPYNDSANLRRPCMIIDNPQVLRNAVHKHVPLESHKHSEDIVNDPEVIRFIDEYSERFKELVEPGWIKDINDPNFRWYKGSKRYKKLFEFKSDEYETPEPSVKQKETVEV